VGGTAELVKDNETGILIEPGDENALSEKIIWMIENKEKAKQLGAAGKKTIEENFTMEAMISGTEKVYKELLSRKGI
jgi:glycosyltransferase involved in cell wall biosynthesis